MNKCLLDIATCDIETFWNCYCPKCGSSISRTYYHSYRFVRVICDSCEFKIEAYLPKDKP